jgi:hypothetical protein
MGFPKAQWLTRSSLPTCLPRRRRHHPTDFYALIGIAVACDSAVSHGDKQVYPILVELNLGKYDEAPVREQCRVLVENIECLPPIPRRDKDRLAINIDTGRQEIVHPLLDRRFWWHNFVYLIAFIDRPRYRQCHDPSFLDHWKNRERDCGTFS